MSENDQVKMPAPLLGKKGSRRDFLRSTAVTALAGTALIAASRGGYAEICRLLMAAGANKSLRNSAGVSAADIANGRGFTSIAKELGS